MRKRDDADVTVICAYCAHKADASICKPPETCDVMKCDVCGSETGCFPTKDFQKNCEICKQPVHLDGYTFTKAKRECRPFCEQCRKHQKYEPTKRVLPARCI